MPNPNPLTPSCLSNALPNIPTPLRLVNAFPTRHSFNLSSPSCQVNSRHPHSFPTRHTLNLSSPSCQVDSRHPHSFPTRRTLNLSSSSRQVDSQHLYPVPTQRLSTFSLLVSAPFLTSHRSRDCGWAKPNRVPPSLNAS